MIAHLLIALAAGAASALMFASIVSGALVSILLFYLAPLPLMVAALGWGPLGAAIGGIAAATCLGYIFGMPYLGAFVISVALPAWWLGHLALLGRPVAAAPSALNPPAFNPPAPPVIEWYPVGRILLWTAAFASLTTFGALLTLGFDAATITTSLKRALLRVLSSSGDFTSSEAETGVNALVKIAPSAAALVAIMTLTVNLWLAARITLMSGRLHRPWPDLTRAALPPMTLVALAVAIALSFIGGLPAILAQIVSASLMMAYGLTGFAALHMLTLGRKSRALWLSSTYAIVMVFGWPILMIIAFGIADAFFGFRQRFLQRQQPPPRTT